jgi:acyl carrier protein
MNDDVRNKLKKEILEYVEMEFVEDDEDIELDQETPLISGGLVDSFSMVSLKRFLEKKYHVSIPDAQATPEAFDSVTNIITLLEDFI